MSIYSPSHLTAHPTFTLSLSTEVQPYSFIAHDQNSHNSSPLAAISYVNGFTSSQGESVEEALHISKCFHAPVFGIYHSRTHSIQQESQALCEFYNHTFSIKPNAIIFQIFFGDGGTVVQEAIQLLHPSLQERIVVIGMNPKTLLDHPQARYFQTHSWPFLHSQAHHINPLFIHPDSDSQRLRANDPAFTPVLQSISLPSANLHYHHHKQRKWTQARIHHATNLALTGLCLSAHAAIKSKWVAQSETFRTMTDATTPSLHQHHFTSLMSIPHTISLRTLASSSTIFYSQPQLLLPGGILPNGTLPDGSYPHDIFPGRISPEGKFDLDHIYIRGVLPYYTSYHHTNVIRGEPYPLGNFQNKSFPYLQFFSGITSDCMTKHGKSSNPIAKRSYSPFGVHSDGSFSELPKAAHPYPYGFFHVGGTFIPSKTCKNAFPYYRFFSGELIPERYPDGILPKNDPLYHRLPGGKLPSIYPGDILPNGSFPNPHMEYPFGVFENDSFPYADFFFGKFDYIGRYLEQLEKTNPLLSPFQTNATSTSLVEYFHTSSTPFLYKTTTTSDSVNIDSFSASLAINILTNPIQEHYDRSQDLLSAAWIIQGSALAVLVTTSGSSKVKKIRRIALAITSATTYLAALDLSKQIHCAIYTHQDLFSFSAQGSLILYSVAYLGQELINSPWLKNQYERLARALILDEGSSYTLSNGIQRISNAFQHNMAVIRSLSSLIRMYFISCVGLFFCHCGDSESDPQIYLHFCYLLINLFLIPYAITSVHTKSE